MHKSRTRPPLLLLLPLLFGACATVPAAAPAPSPDPAYAAEIRAFRAQHLKALKADGGWLQLCGLHWLKEGEQSLGSSPEADHRLGEGGPGIIGRMRLAGGRVRFTADAGLPAVDQQGRAVRELELRSDEDPGGPDKLAAGPFTFFIIIRGGKPAIRVYDKHCPNLKRFAGIQAYKPDPTWRKPARFVPYARSKTVTLTTRVNTRVDAQAPGKLCFDHAGAEHCLNALAEDQSKEFFIVFGDKTNGKETYGGGRFLSAPIPRAGEDATVLDFNKAVIPPCAITDFATCPIPRPENRLPFPVRAGEQRAGGGH